MFDSDAAAQTEAQRAAVIELLNATMEADQASQVLATRIDAKMAHAALLTRATFNDDPEDAAWAAALAQDQQTTCLSYLLG